MFWAADVLRFGVGHFEVWLEASRLEAFGLKESGVELP